MPGSKAIHLLLASVLAAALAWAGDAAPMLTFETAPFERGIPYADEQEAEDPSADPLPAPRPQRRKAWQAGRVLPFPVSALFDGPIPAQAQALAVRHWRGTYLPGLSCLKLPSGPEPATEMGTIVHSLTASAVPLGARRSLFLPWAIIMDQAARGEHAVRSC